MTTSRLNLRNVAIACLTATVIFASCKKDTPDLNGSVTISPTDNVFVGDELIAAYSGTETVTWQWKKDGAAIGSATSDKYTPTETGSYTATASAAGFKSRTSAAAVEVRAIQNLTGTVTITPTANVFTGDELTAAYGGSETVAVTWQWNKSGTAISGATNAKFTPAEAGNYSVTASAKGYNSKTSAVVEVKPVFLLEKRETFETLYVYEYDSQDRLTKISIYPIINGVVGQLNRFETFRYNAADGHMEEWNEGNRNMTWSKNSNKITCTYEFGGMYVVEYELNPQGLPVKYTNHSKVHENDNWNKVTRNFSWENGNITQDVWIQEWKEGVEEGSNTWIGIFTYDDKKSPFYHSKTPKWVLDWYTGDNEVSLVSNNNVKTLTWDNDGGSRAYENTYNADGLLETRTRTGDSGSTETYTYKKK